LEKLFKFTFFRHAMIVTRSRAASRSATPVLESESEEQNETHFKRVKMEACNLRDSFEQSATHTKTTACNYPNRGQNPNRRKIVRKYADTLMIPKVEQKDLQGLIIEDLSEDQLRGILRLAGATVEQNSSLAERVYSILSHDLNAVKEMVAVGVLPYMPSDLETLKMYPSPTKVDMIVTEDTKVSSALADVEEDEPIIVPFTPEKFFEELEDNEPLADQILREMMAGKTRMGQTRMSKRSKRSKLSTSLYLNKKFGGDQEVHSIPASRRRFRSGSSLKKESVLKKCPFKHRLLIKVDGSNPLTAAKVESKRRRGTGRS